MAKCLTLLSDFGTRDPYVGEMKAVLLKIAGLQMVDLTHEVPAYEIEWGAFQLLRAYHHFPKGTCHLAIVDPGVGTTRQGVYVRTKNYHFVGPNNGVLLWAVRDAERRDKKKAEVFEIPPAKKGEVLPTFHGRDVFAPFVCQVLKSAQKGLKKTNLEGRDFPEAKLASGHLDGEILGRDAFGNVVTTVRHDGMKDADAEMGWSRSRVKSVENYQSIPDGSLALVRGSHGFWELATYRGSAWERSNVRPGDRIKIFSK